jgi:hypothetical protein
VAEDFSGIPESEDEERERWWASWSAATSIVIVSIFVILVAVGIWWLLATYPDR